MEEKMMRKNWFLVLGLILLLGLTFSLSIPVAAAILPVDEPPVGSQTIPLGNLNPSTYHSNEWHFVINGLKNGLTSPPGIWVEWNNAPGVYDWVPRTTDNSQQAGYTTEKHLDTFPISGHAYVIPATPLWNGNFVVSHGPTGPYATITVVKNYTAGEAVFNFTTNSHTEGSGLPIEINITTSTNTGSTYTGSQSHIKVAVGTYGVFETPGNWVLTSSTISKQGTPGLFTVVAGEDVIVTFNNEGQPGSSLPELPAAALFGLGLAGMGAFLIIRRRRSTASTR
jgi:hypothetical protein